eukprot:TRINITY_DN6536_c1_g1_i2.p1 TRINITY_DN6536_c1_g1~~TRINITY_DN6536_c1_g1_i2.p1  ORF type:complete len:495 (-),score=104.48 TRINITY_DN6536_c1_g1_i2:227-1711(-)
MEAPIFYPTMDEFRDFQSYVEKIERVAVKFGVAKIVPPKEWKAREDYTNIDLLLTKPARQHRTGTKGAFEQIPVESKSTKLEAFRDKCREDDERFGSLDAKEMERRFWKNVGITKPTYGADIPGSLYDGGVCVWNLNKVDDPLMQRLPNDIPGVNSPYLYVGAHLTSFGWHVEDMDLYSINYLHCGLPKFWYSISPDDGPDFEQLAKSEFPELAQACKAFLRHKTVVLSPQHLKSRGIPYCTLVQGPGEFVITMPYAYHSGFNFGFNIAEAVNFMTKRWVPFGRKAALCTCHDFTVRIDMNLYEDIQGVFLGSPETPIHDDLTSKQSLRCYRCNKARTVGSVPKGRRFRCSVFPGMSCVNFGVSSQAKSATKAKKPSATNSTKIPSSASRRSKSPSAADNFAISSMLMNTNASDGFGDNPLAVDHWIQCDTCNKWRRIPQSCNHEAFGDRFRCDMLEGVNCLVYLYSHGFNNSIAIIIPDYHSRSTCESRLNRF